MCSGCPLELGEDGELVPSVFGVGVRNFEKHRVIALNDEWAESHN